MDANSHSFCLIHSIPFFIDVKEEVFQENKRYVSAGFDEGDDNLTNYFSLEGARKQMFSIISLKQENTQMLRKDTKIIWKNTVSDKNRRDFHVNGGFLF